MTNDFHLNKKILSDCATVPTKRLRNKIAGYATHLMRRIQTRPVKGISLKIQEEVLFWLFINKSGKRKKTWFYPWSITHQYRKTSCRWSRNYWYAQVFLFNFLFNNRVGVLDLISLICLSSTPKLTQEPKTRNN